VLPLALSLVLATAPQASPSRDGLAAVRSVLQRTEGARSAPDEVLVRRLVALGSPAAPALFALVSGEGVEALFAGDAEEAWLCPPDRVGELALAALAELPEVPVRTLLRARCGESPTREVRAAALRVLGRQGSPEGLAQLLEVLAACGEELEHHSVRASALEALRELLRADGGTLRALEKPLLEATPVEQRLVCEALADCGRRESVALLGKLVGRSPELDLTLLESQAALGERYAWLVADLVAPRLRSALEHGDPRMRAAAARALGRTRDGQAVAGLIARLADADGAVARAAQWSLREITGRDPAGPGKPATREEWQRWFEVESAWWQAQGRAHLDVLEAGDATRLAPSLRALLAHPLGRDQVADALSGSLGGLEAGAQVLACDALARLGARRAVPALVELLLGPTPEVRNAAWGALRALTGADLPAEPRPWEDYAAG
jgi:HEAT repeat protein